jgi:hydroxyethylthiazole kinase
MPLKNNIMINSSTIFGDLETIRRQSPLVHNITNYVVMNSTANALLALGASPVMAHALDEVRDMVNIASSLVINMGTLSEKWVEAMILAGKRASERGIPVVFDPVGAGATPYRTSSAMQIIKSCSPAVIRGNASEIMALINEGIETKGVDSTASSDAAVDSARALARQTGAVVVISGSEDYITNGETLLTTRNGNPLMARVTGMGCTATAVIGAFIAVNSNILVATAHAMAIMGIAGELAAERSEGPGSMQWQFYDSLHTLSEKDISGKFKA